MQPTTLSHLATLRLVPKQGLQVLSPLTLPLLASLARRFPIHAQRFHQSLQSLRQGPLQRHQLRSCHHLLVLPVLAVELRLLCRSRMAQRFLHMMEKMVSLAILLPSVGCTWIAV